MARPRSDLIVLLAAVTTVAGCLTSRVHERPPAQLRAEIASAVPDLSPSEVVIPHEISAETLAQVDQMVSGPFPEGRNLLSLLFGEGQMGLRYQRGATRDANVTVSAGGGNCVSLAALVVAVARAHGSPARYVEIDEPAEHQSQGDLNVWEGHVGVLLPGREGPMVVDFAGAQRAERAQIRLITDRTLVAHFYNNRGVERILRAREDGTPAPWEEARRQFFIATRIDPRLGRAWNNLGVALARLGELDAAEAAYRRALRIANRHLDGAAALNLVHLETRRLWMESD